MRSTDATTPAPTRLAYIGERRRPRQDAIRRDSRRRRIVDVTLALAGLALAAPILLTVATRRGLRGERAFVGQRLVGKRGVEFEATLLAPASEQGNANEWDRRLARLPLLLHVLTGNITLVGPRVADWSEIEGVHRPLRAAATYLTARPGLISSGYAEVGTDAPAQHRILAECRYDHHRSTLADIHAATRALLALIAFQNGRRATPPRGHSRRR
jgi:lipopolysaccharide/colanic/teichoic acid biosynthesis glycosyltransferase